MFGNYTPYNYGQQAQNPYNYVNQAQNPYNYGQQAQTPYNYGNQIPNQQTNTNKIFVSGLEDVKNWKLGAGSEFVFLDNDKPLLYEKIVNNTGQFEIKMFDIIPHKETNDNALKLDDYVSKEEFNKLLNEFNSLKEKIKGETNEPVKKQPIVSKQ